MGKRGVAIAGLLPITAVFAQMGSWGVAEQDLGRPADPPFISFLGIMGGGKMVTDLSLLPKGPVVATVTEEFGQAGPKGPADQLAVSTRMQYDERGRVVEKSETSWGRTTNTAIRYDGRREISEEATNPDSKTPHAKFWIYWTYDRAGKLTDYRRGSGDELQNHETNFTRDAQGRLTGFEYRQGEKDVLFSRTTIQYSPDGKTMETSVSEGSGEFLRSVKQTIDDQGRVVQALITNRDGKTKKATPPLKVAFKYDAKGRLVEQDTAPYDSDPSGGEHELPPRKVSVSYDDVKRTRTTSYASPEGALSCTLTFDESGTVTGQVTSSGTESFEARVSCSYDVHGNWTSCERLVTQDGASALNKKWRRTITYR